MAGVEKKYYRYGSFKNFIRSTGPETDRRIKYWAPIYFQVEGAVWEQKCICKHGLKSHRWVLGESPKYSIETKECKIKKCRCGLGTQDNLKWIENLKP